MLITVNICFCCIILFLEIYDPLFDKTPVGTQKFGKRKHKVMRRQWCILHERVKNRKTSKSYHKIQRQIFLINEETCGFCYMVYRHKAALECSLLGDEWSIRHRMIRYLT